MLENPPRTSRPTEAAPQESAEAACRGWYEAYGDPLYSYLRFHLASPDLAEDLTSEVFLRAFRSFDRFDASAGSPRAWLFRIAQNALRDHLRQSKRRQTVPMTAMWDLESPAPSPEERLLWEEEVAGLLSAVNELSGKDREVISLCYGSELSIADASEILGLTDTATRTRLWRALRRLRKIVAG
jgi:RNA polymerase sigma-70 factor, ECF subfamily